MEESSPMFLPRRLRKCLGDCTSLSLAEIELAWTERRIQVACPGSREREVLPLEQLVYGDDQVFLDGVAVRRRLRHEHIIFNKPSAVTTTTRDPEGKQDLSAWLLQMPPGLFPVGRLDRETTGLLFFTTDGNLANAILRPDQKLPKRYWLFLNEAITEGDPRLTQFLEGIPILGHTLRADDVQLEREDPDFTELEVTLTQGRNRQIRRMCRALDLRLVHLHRRAIGPLGLGSLSIGEWRALEDEEVESLWAAVGGRAHQARQKVAALAQVAARLRREGRPEERLERWLTTRDARGEGEVCGELL